MTNTAVGYPDPDDDPNEVPSWLRPGASLPLPQWLAGLTPEERRRAARDPLFALETMEAARELGEVRRRYQELRDAETEPSWSPTPLVGYRFWDVTVAGLTGRRGFTWPEPVLHAECRRSMRGQKAWGEAPHRRDEGGCRGLCGVNAYGNAAHLVAEAMKHPVGFGPGRPDLPHRRPIPSGAYGVVSMWGRVIEHRLGYRSEWARVTGVVVVTNTWAGTIVGSGALPRFFEDPFEAFIDRTVWDPISLDRSDPSAVRTTMIRALETIGGSQ